MTESGFVPIFASNLEVGPRWVVFLEQAAAWLRGRRLAGRGEGGLSDFTCLVKGYGSQREIRAALVMHAGRAAGARRVELRLDEAPDRAPWLAARWPGTEPEPECGSPRRREAHVVDVELRFAGRSRGVLRLFLDRPIRSRRVLHDVQTLATLAAATETVGERPDRDIATRDALTGVHNEPFLDAFLSHALALARRRGEPLSLLCIGTDGWPAARARHGGDLADAALRRLARAVVGTLRASDVVARLDGDDGRFVAVLPGAAAAVTPRVAEAVRRAIAEAGTASGLTPPLTATLGAATFPDDADSPAALRATTAAALDHARATRLAGVEAPLGTVG